MPAAEQGRFSTPVSSKHHNNGEEDTRTKQDEVDLEGPSPPPLAAPLSDDTLDASSSAEKQQATAAADRRVPVGRSESPFAATPSPIGNRTLSNSEDIANDDTIDGTFDTGNNNSISRTLNISEIDESASLFLNSNNNNTVSANGEASASSRLNSTSNDTTLKSILELSEIDTTFDGAALNRTIGATDASTSASSRHRPPRDLSEIDTTMDAGTAGSTSSTGNANSIEESKLQAELAVDASERMQRMLEEVTSTGGGGADGEDENSTLAGQAFVGGGSGASVITSGGSMASYSVGGNTVATAGTDIADFLRKQNEAMQRALAGAGVDVGEETIISPTKTRAVDAAVENARIMAEATAKLTPGSSGGANVTGNNQSSAVRNSSMEFGSQSHLNVGATGKFTTDDATGAVTVQSVKTNMSDDKGAAGATNNKSTPNSKPVRSKATSSSSSSAYQSQYALSPSQRAKESMSVAEKIRQAEAEAMARDGGPTFEKMAAVNETDDDYVPIADYSSSAKKNKKKQGQTVGSFDYNDYSPDNMIGSSEVSAVQRYRIMMRRKKRRRQRRMIRAGLVALVIGAVLFWWYRGGTGNTMVDDENYDSALENDEDARPDDEDEVGVEPPVYRVDNEIEAAGERPSDDIQRENTEEVIENDDGDSAEEEDSIDGVSKDSTMESEADPDSLASAFAREKIQLINADQAPIVKLFHGVKAVVSNTDPRTIPFSHLWNKEVRQGAKSQPVLSGIDELLDSMMQ